MGEREREREKERRRERSRAEGRGEKKCWWAGLREFDGPVRTDGMVKARQNENGILMSCGVWREHCDGRGKLAGSPGAAATDSQAITYTRLAGNNSFHMAGCAGYFFLPAHAASGELLQAVQYFCNVVITSCVFGDGLLPPFSLPPATATFQSVLYIGWQLYVLDALRSSIVLRQQLNCSPAIPSTGSPSLQSILKCEAFREQQRRVSLLQR
jgi:hypothetical protein